MTQEVELKFDVDPGAVGSLRGAGMLSATPSEANAHDTIYFDTKNGTLRQAGYSLRIRRSGARYVQTIKRKPRSAAGLFVRREWEADVPSFNLAPDVLKSSPFKPVLEKVGNEKLVPLIRTRFRRTLWLIDHRGSRIEVVLDEGSVRCGKVSAPLCELELELKAGKPSALFHLATEIGMVVPLRLGVLTKAERGYAMAEKRLGCSAKAEPVSLAAPISEAQAFRTVAHSCLRHYRLNEMVLLSSRDAEALHQARIALRRLRSAFSLFRPTIRGKEYQHLREELGWLAGQLGDARNVDVLLGDETDPAGTSDLPRTKLLKARDKAYDRVLAALHSDRARVLMLRLALWMEVGPWRFRERASRDLLPLAEQRLERQWRKVRRHGSRLGKLNTEARHRLRLDIKKLRYTSEFLAGLWTKKPALARRDRFIGALKELQERLGELNDAEAAEKLKCRLAPGLQGSAAKIRRDAVAAETIAAGEEALNRAAAVAGYWARPN